VFLLLDHKGERSTTTSGAFAPGKEPQEKAVAERWTISRALGSVCLDERFGTAPTHRLAAGRINLAPDGGGDVSQRYVCV
jgi:hypothetical protein